MSKRPFPPPNYEAVPSKLKGVELYRAKQPKEALPTNKNMKDAVYFRCPQCTAPKAYQIESGKLHCDYCGYEGDIGVDNRVFEVEDGKFEFTTDSIIHFSDGWGEERLELVCQVCNGTVSIEANSLTHSCPFCSSTKVIRRKDIEERMHPQHLIPFQLKQEACQNIVRHWLGKSQFTPKHLAKAAFIEEIKPIYLPFWRFGSHFDGTFSFLVGIEDEIEVTYEGTEYSKTQVVWKRRQGKLVNRFEEALEVGTSLISRKLFNKISAYSWSFLVPYQPEYLVGIAAKGYDLPLDQAWKKGRVRIRERVRRSVMTRGMGEKKSVRISNLHLNIEIKDAVWHYILLPLYLIGYQYHGKRYYILVNGESGAIAGTRPIDWTRVWLICLAWLAPGLFFSLLGGYVWSQMEMSNTIFLFLAVGLLGLIVAFVNFWHILRELLELGNE